MSPTVHFPTSSNPPPSSNNSSNNNFFATPAMPLSRTRSLLSNINGHTPAANAANAAASSSAQASAANSALVTPINGAANNGHAQLGGVGVLSLDSYSGLPSLSGEHLPPLKAGAAGSNSYLNSNSKASNAAVTNGGSVVVTSGLIFNTSGGTVANGVPVSQQQLNNSSCPQTLELDNMSTTGSIISTASHGLSSLTNGHSNGSSSLHMNGMQTLPHVRASGPTATNGQVQQQNSDPSSSVVNGSVNGSGALESPKHLVNGNSANLTNGGTNGTNGSAPPVSTSANNLKSKTMVASPEQVMKLYMNKLTPYEHHEIFNYPQIYFIGANAKKRPGIIGAANNCGYDDDQGSYTHIPHDHLAYRYEVLKVIGKGSFGQVVKAYDHKNHHHVQLQHHHHVLLRCLMMMMLSVVLVLFLRRIL